MSATRALRPDVESDDDDRGRCVVGLRRRGEQHVRFGDRTDTGTNDANLDLLSRKLLERSLENLDRTLHVGLENDEKLFDLGHAERFDAAFGGLEHRRLTCMHLPLTGDRLRPLDVGDNLERIAGLRHTLQAEYLDRCRRLGLRHRFAAVGEHRPHLARKLPDDERIADLQSSLLDQSRRDRTAALIEFCFEHNAGSTTRRAGFQVENICLQQDRLEQSVEIFAVSWPRPATISVSPPQSTAAGRGRRDPV